MDRRAPITIPNVLHSAEDGTVASPMPWASDYAAPTPSFPVTPQAQIDATRQALSAQREAQQRSALVLQCLSRSHVARAQLAVLRSKRISARAAHIVGVEATAATSLQALCRAHLVQQLRAWFTATASLAPTTASADTTSAADRGSNRRKFAQRATQRRHPSVRSTRLGTADTELKAETRKGATQTSKENIGELKGRIRSLERQLGRTLGQPETAARNMRSRRRSRARTAVNTSSSSLRVKARPTVGALMSMSAADVHIHSSPALESQKRNVVGKSKSVGALRSTEALDQFSVEWSHGSVDGWSQWLPRHRWFQGLASQLHALHSLADPLVGADDDTRSYIREYVERELSYPHRTSGHRMDGGNAVESAVAHASAWKPGSAAISSKREFGPPPDLPGRRPPTVPSREHWTTRLSRRSARNMYAAVPTASIGSAHSVTHERLQVTLRQDVGGTTGFGIVLQCAPSTSVQDRRLQPPSNAAVTAVTPGSDAAAAGIVPGMAVLRVNGNHLHPDTSVAELSHIFEEIVDLPEVNFEFEAKGFISGPGGSVGSSTRPMHSSASVNPHGWCARAQNRVCAARLGKQEVMIVVLWNGGGTARTAASSMCEHAAHQLADVLSQCFTHGLLRDVICVEAGAGLNEPSDMQESDATLGHVWPREADELLRKIVPENTSPTGGQIAWPVIAAKLTGWSRTSTAPFMYSGRGCQERWEQVLDPNLHQWASLRPPELSIWWCNGMDDSTGGDVIVPEKVYSYISEADRETKWPSEDEVVTLVGARIHDHLERTEQDTEGVVSALHKQVRQQMRNRRELHTEIGSWQKKNRELERKCASLAAAELSQKQGSGTAETIYNAIHGNPLRPRAAPSRDTTPAGAAAEDLVPELGKTTAAMLPVTDVTTIPMPVLSAAFSPES